MVVTTETEIEVCAVCKKLENDCECCSDCLIHMDDHCKVCEQCDCECEDEIYD